MKNFGFQINHFQSPQMLAKAAAMGWCRRIAGAEGPFTVALSGGRIANDFFKAVVVEAGQNEGIRHAHFFWADERCVPPDHDDSNYRVAQELLFEPLRIEASHIHRIRGEDEPAQAAAYASQELLRVAGGAGSSDRINAELQRGAGSASAVVVSGGAPGTARPALPVLDWVFLGMGEDGHVASLFPGAVPYHGIYYDVIGPKPPPQRITVSYDVLAAAKEVWVLASGLGKEAALQEAVRPDGRNPLAQVLQSRKRTDIFSDIPMKTP